MIITPEMNRIALADPRAGHALRAAAILEDVMLHYYNRDYVVQWDDREKYAAAAIKLEVDKKCDDLARAYLTSLYGMDDTWGFLGEESFDPAQREREYYWCVDPICGSLGYRKKTDNFGTSIALIHRGKPIIGVLNCPRFQWTGLACLEPAPAAAWSENADPPAGRRHLIVSANKRESESLRNIVDRLNPTKVTYAESVPVKSLGVIMGKFDLFYGLPSTLGGGRYNIWDIAATAAFAAVDPQCVLSDAWGEPISLSQESPRFTQGIIMARNRDLWREAVEATRARSGEIGPAPATASAPARKRRNYFVSGLRCTLCGAEHEERPGLYTCPSCGPEGILDVLYDYDAASWVLSSRALAHNTERSHWRYSAVMPVDASAGLPPLRVGGSPLYELPELARAAGVKRLWVKDDGLNPTASLKDRASSVGVARALAENARAITCASTGNAASSLAGAAASIGLPAFIFVPRNAPQPKIAQLLIFGAHVFVVDGSYEDAFDLSMACAQDFGFYNRNSGFNPYLVEGKKTVTWEMAEQMAWSPPECLFFSVGDGCTIAGAAKGCIEMKRMGFIDKLPRIIGVQAEGAAPIFRAWTSGEPVRSVVPDTIADSIAVGSPRNAVKAINAVRETGGFFMTVSDREILDAMKILGNRYGVFGEPAGVTGLAGLMRAARENLVASDITAGVVITGNGLKDAQSASKAAGEPRRVPPDTAAVSAIIKGILES